MRREHWIQSDMNRMIRPTDLTGEMFEGDGGDRIGVRLHRKGIAEPASGSIYGYVIKPDGSMINRIAGGRTGNSVWVDLPGSAYTIPGIIEISIKMEEGGAVTTLGIVKAKVYNAI